MELKTWLEVNDRTYGPFITYSAISSEDSFRLLSAGPASVAGLTVSTKPVSYEVFTEEEGEVESLLSGNGLIDLVSTKEVVIKRVPTVNKSKISTRLVDNSVEIVIDDDKFRLSRDDAQNLAMELVSTFTIADRLERR